MSLTREHKRSAGAGGLPSRGGPLAFPPELIARLAPGTVLATPEQCRAALARLGLCDAARPAVTLELYGGLRLKAGCRVLPLHAGTVGEALEVLRAACPKVARLLPAAEELGEHYRFSLNGRGVTADLGHALQSGDHLIVFSASVGG
ncbi:MAG TPA: MoaD/ThiS family protein [bacterium]|jgi:molybdopterin converting factor small subunit